MSVPQAAIDAVAEAMIADYPVKAETLRRLAATALEAAAPHIAAAERDRIRQLAIKHGARFRADCEDWPGCPDGRHYRTHYKPFADLLGESS